MTSLAVRVTNVDDETTVTELAEFFQSRGVPVASGRSRMVITMGADCSKTAVISFQDDAAMQKALSLSASERQFREKQMDLDHTFDGFTTLSEGQDLDIVALHGLNGHAFTTWEDVDRTNRFMWLRDCLPEHFPQARVLTYGYNANVLSDVSTGRLRNYAETFSENLRHERSSETHRDSPLILMAHSLGGLVLKQALIIANTRADRRYHEILESICGIVFFGTPHRGGNGVKSGVFVANLLKAVNVDARTDLLKSLDPRSLALFDLTDDFRQIVEAMGITIHTFFETNKTKIKVGPFTTKRILIVDEQSAILGVARERKATVNADHSHMCKFSGPSDNSYVRVRRVLKELIDAATPIVTTRDSSSQPDTPSDLKYASLTDPNKLDSDEKQYPVLVWGENTYWALSHIDNRFGMTILAYNSQNPGRPVGRWEKLGARYVHAIRRMAGRLNSSGKPISP